MESRAWAPRTLAPREGGKGRVRGKRGARSGNAVGANDEPSAFHPHRALSLPQEREDGVRLRTLALREGTCFGLKVMRSKISLTLSEDVLEALDRLAGPSISRPEFVETILRDFVEGSARRNAREAVAINRHAAELDAGMAEALSFQARASIQGTP